MPIVLLRHGERLDYVDPNWLPNSPHPWDPPLTDRGRRMAYHAGRALQNILKTEGLPPVSRIASSPLLRCLQTSIWTAKGIASSDELPRSEKVLPLCIEPGLVESVCGEWYHAWGIVGTDGTWGGPRGRRFNSPQNPPVPAEDFIVDVRRKVGDVILHRFLVDEDGSSTAGANGHVGSAAEAGAYPPAPTTPPVEVGDHVDTEVNRKSTTSSVGGEPLCEDWSDSEVELFPAGRSRPPRLISTRGKQLVFSIPFAAVLAQEDLNNQQLETEQTTLHDTHRTSEELRQQHTRHSDAFVSCGEKTFLRFDPTYTPHFPKEYFDRRYRFDPPINPQKPHRNLETDQDVGCRVAAVAKHLQGLFPNETVLLCSHGGPVSAAFEAMVGRPLPGGAKYCCISVLELVPPEKFIPPELGGHAWIPIVDRYVEHLDLVPAEGKEAVDRSWVVEESSNL